MERLAFGYGRSGHGGDAPAPGDRRRQTTQPATAAETGSTSPAAANTPVASRRTDWAFVGLMIFTGLLFFRPQDMYTPLRRIPLAEIAALFALGSLATGRLSRGLPISRVTPELVGVVGLGAVMVMMAPFGIWFAGSIGTFMEMYSKVILIFVLMVNTLTTPKRIEQFTWVIVIASGYIAGRAVIDYARGVNLVEYGRVMGSVGGMFKNPNDLALNMVAVLPLAAMLALRQIALPLRALAALGVLLMVGSIVASQSRSGTVGLAAMALMLAVQIMRRRPGLVFAGIVAIVLAMPMLPEAYWERIASIADESKDQTGSREARSILLREAYDAFLDYPITGVGAGQFVNYNPDRTEAWHEAHNFLLQVAAELGIFGLMTIVFLVGRGLYAPMQTRRLLRAMAPGARSSPRRPAPPPLGAAEHDMMTAHAAALPASLAGWFVCALFASVAYHWTFYYLLALAVAPRDYLLGRVNAGRVARTSAPAALAVGTHP